MDNDPDGNIQSMAWPTPCVKQAPGFIGSLAAVDMELLIEFSTTPLLGERPE